jgi:chemotaxis protein MotA
LDLLTIIGVLLAVAAVFGAQILEGGHLSSLLQPTAALIVFGGTVGAIFIQYSASTVGSSVGLAFEAFFRKKHDLRDSVDEVVGFARQAQREGILALEKRIGSVEWPFMKKGLQLVVDGAGVNEVKEILGIEIHYEEERRFQAARVFESAGGYAPTLGILGAVMGLIHVMENLAEPANLGQGIAVAFVATVYGVASANLFWIPIAGKIKINTRADSVRKELAVEGLVALASGENPRVIEERLSGFLASAKRADERGA